MSVAWIKLWITPEKEHEENKTKILSFFIDIDFFFGNPKRKQKVWNTIQLAVQDWS